MRIGLQDNTRWYPPAEVRVSIQALISALLPGNAGFHEMLGTYLGLEHCICAGSARMLFSLLLQELWKREGKQRDQVLIPGYTCYSVAASVARAGLKIRVYDLDPGTFQPDLDSVKLSLDNNILAVVTQHLFGIPSPVMELKKLAGEAGAYLIEDAAQSLGASLDGQQTGTLGDFGFFSFGRGKPLPLGWGGAMVGRYPSILEEIHWPREGRGYRQLLTTAMIQVLSHPIMYGFMEALPLGLGETIFDPGFEVSSMSPVLQRLGRHAIESLKDLNAHRCSVAEVYSNELGGYGPIAVAGGSCPIYTRFPLMAGSGTIPQELKRLGIRRMYPKALTDEPDIRRFFADEGVKTPGASMIAEKLMTLPTHMGISRDTASAIAFEIKGFSEASRH